MAKSYSHKSLRDFLGACFSVVSRRRSFLMVLSWLFFIVLIIGVVLSSTGLVEISPSPFSEPFTLTADNVVVLFLFIFFSNLLLSGFLLLTASGMLFFALPAGLLFFRALLWGVFLAQLSTYRFLTAFPTLVLEGEGYVFAAIAGVELGLSWLKPGWMFRGESLSRLEAFKLAARESARLYVFVTLLLLAAATVETITIFSVA
jgi:hypothetical protein